MKILMLAHRFPYPPTQGDSLRAWAEVRFLSARHDLWLACLHRTQPQPDHLTAVRECCRDLAVMVRPHTVCLLRGGLSLLRGRSLTAGYFYDPRLARVIRQWDQAVGFDAVLTFSGAMAPYAGLVHAARRVLDLNDVESHKWASYARHGSPLTGWLYRLEASRLRLAEADWVASHDVSLVVNECERAKLPTTLRDRAVVVRTGIDLDFYRPADAAGQPPAPPIDEQDPRRSSSRSQAAAFPPLPAEPVIGFVGSLGYPPNVRAVNWFGTRVWPLIRDQLPQARWLIVGRQPTRSVRRWARQAGVTVTGLVDDVRPYLHSMRVFICPAQEQIGVQTKLIQALAAARPAVVTPQAAAGMEFDDPPPFLIAGTPIRFADAVLRLLRDQAAARKLAARALSVAHANYDAQEQMERLEAWLSHPHQQPVAAPHGRATSDLACGSPGSPPGQWCQCSRIPVRAGSPVATHVAPPFHCPATPAPGRFPAGGNACA